VELENLDAIWDRGEHDDNFVVSYNVVSRLLMSLPEYPLSTVSCLK
jgi:hypothetical protein